jgi:hypothetical protein
MVRRGFVALVITTFAGVVALAQAPDPMLGNWKLNVAKSKTAYKSGTTLLEKAGDAVKATVDLVGADGTAYHWTWTTKYDGKDSPVTGNTPYGKGAMTASATKADSHTVTVVGKMDGKVVVTQTLKVSADGKTRTVTTKGTDAKGQPVDTVSIYDKQ